jgi:Asp-tRNA(Asn)/Glu-tRNA(Gln) amidotransferase C subunit
MSKEMFLRIAEVSGLDVKDEAHMEELYTYLQGVLPGLRKVDELDLTNVEPAMVYIPPKE